MEKRKILLWGAAAALAALLVFFLSRSVHPLSVFITREAVAPFGRFVNAAEAAAHDSGWYYDDIMLQAKLFMAEGLEEENRELRRLLELRDRTPGAVCADVISSGGDGWWRTLRLDKGSSSGISAGDVVVCSEGLVGRVVYVTPRTSDVLLITDYNSRVACSVEGAGRGSRGIVTGGGAADTGTGLGFLNVVEPLDLAYVREGSGMAGGDKVVTSGLGGVFPAGIPVGSVVKVYDDDSLLYTRADVAPFVDFASLRAVMVLTAGAAGKTGKPE